MFIVIAIFAFVSIAITVIFAFIYIICRLKYYIFLIPFYPLY